MYTENRCYLQGCTIALLRFRGLGGLEIGAGSLFAEKMPRLASRRPIYSRVAMI